MHGSAANWAQVSGNKEQNTVTQSAGVFRFRWGHAMAAYYDIRRHVNALLLVGGDTYDPASGLGSLNNDVWTTRTLGAWHDNSETTARGPLCFAPHLCRCSLWMCVCAHVWLYDGVAASVLIVTVCVAVCVC